FRNKPVNRRFRRDHVLDVKMRSDKARGVRVRLASRVAAIALGTLITLFLIWRGGQWVLNASVYQNEAFAIETIDVRTDGILSPEEIRRIAAVKPGDNLMALDLLRIKRDLELVPVIQSASVERLLPRALRLRITEREPVAMAYLVRPKPNGAGYEPVIYHFDVAGYAFLPPDRRVTTLPSGQPIEPLPILTGVKESQIRIGQPIESPQAQAALRLVLAFDQSPMVGVADVNRIDVSAPDVLRVTTEQGAEIVFSLANLDAQLRRWRAIHDESLKHGRVIRGLDLSVANNIPLRLADASTTPLPNPKPIKPPRTRKK